jgi:uncharacterized membrane protein YhdT
MPRRTRITRSDTETVHRSRPRSLTVGLVLFAVGVAFVVVDVAPFLAGDRETPLWLNLACLLAPIGFGVCVWSALRPGRADQRAALRRLSDR